MLNALTPSCCGSGPSMAPSSLVVKAMLFTVTYTELHNTQLSPPHPHPTTHCHLYSSAPATGFVTAP
jgi:hypothetical protein